MSGLLSRAMTGAGGIYHTAVKEEFRGQGIGKELVNRALAALKAEGITRCGLFVFADNVAGQNFWLSQGWVTRPDLVYFNLPLCPETNSQLTIIGPRLDRV